MSDGIKPTRIEREGYPLPDEVSIDGSYTGDDVDWDSSPGMLGFDQWKQPVRAATTAAITIATALNNGDTIDGVTLATGDRVLVKDQGTHSQNGIYIVGATPARADDFDEDAEVLGAVVYVIAGGQTGTVWTCTNTTATVVDTDAIDWAQLSGGASGANDTSLVTVSAAGATETIDVSVARTYDVTLTADCTLTLTGAVTAEAWFVTILLRQDGTGGWVVTWPGSVVWAGGSAPTLSTTPGDVDTVTLVTVDGGTVWLGYPVGVAGEPIATAHVADTTDAHDASAVSIADAGAYYTGTDVEAALQEIGAGGIGGGGGHYEVVVSGSAPPVAVSTPSDDDWVYAWVAN